MAGIYENNKEEFVTSLAALCLYDGEAEISSANITALLEGSNNEVAPYWAGLFASMLKNGRAEELVFSLGCSGPAAGAAGAAAAGGDAPAAVEEKKAEVEEVDALDGGMDMFGGGGGGGDY
eukprot:CAMPEP_0181307338 /NCGR_PEP_ID=MMETSP1101-20121128/10821_1 /TAXON_ID=46948 /ORGANISM="Rhodomonas abbreviata, Strain Caron Lab Isolate" /LENGTH=120 /DNA_ID=CAMNT_0023413537 /DNA_START=40 /DNA_END=402 /DNA_ORIENTATION=+